MTDASVLIFNPVPGNHVAPLRDARDLLKGRPLAYDLYSGVGGMTLGLEQAGFEVAVSVELDVLAAAYAGFNLPGTLVLSGPVHGDVRTISAEKFAKARPDRSHRTVALVAGGPPCQGFSLAGHMNTRDRLNGLLSRFATVVLDIKPLAFCLENVPGVMRGNSGALRRALRRLTREYRIGDPEALWAHDFGVPQARERVFVIGIRRDLGVLPTFPTPTHAGTQLGNQLLPVVTVEQAILDLPSVGLVPSDDHKVAYDRLPGSQYARVMRRYERDPLDFSLTVAWSGAICHNMAPTIHGKDVGRRFKALKPGRSDPVSGVRRLELTGVAPTIRAGTTPDRGSRSAPRPVHPVEARVVTTRECARLQSFPDWFDFHPTRWHGNRQVGNAVPPLLARAIGRHIMVLLGFSPPVSVPEHRIARDVRLMPR